SRVEDVVDQHDPLAVQGKGNVAAEQARISGAALAVVTIRGNVERADRDLPRAVRIQFEREPFSQAGAATHDTHDGAAFSPAVAFGDFVRDPLDGTRDGGGIEGHLRLRTHGRTRKKTRLRTQPG